MLQETLKILRKKCNKSQIDVALAIGMTKQAYSNYETGYREPDLKTICRLADYFQVSVDYLLGHSDELGNAYNAEQDSLSHDEKTLLEAYKALPENLKFHAVGIIRSLANIPTEDNIVKFPNK